MNMFQRINITASLAVVGALGVGLYAGISKLEADKSLFQAAAEYKHALLLSLFIILFKMKTMFDDHQHFGEEHQKKGGFRHIGFLLAMFSWLFWVFGAYAVLTPFRASELMIISIAISTAWIAVHIIEILLDKRRKEELITSLLREKWVLINIGYILILGTYLGWLVPIILKGNIWAIVTLLVLLFFDYISSESWPGEGI
jgi:hypothetical protein